MIAQSQDKKIWELHEECVNFIILINSPILDKIIPGLIIKNNKNEPITSEEISMINTARSAYVAHKALLFGFVDKTADLKIINSFQALNSSLDQLSKYLETLTLLYRENKGKNLLVGQQLNVLKSKFINIREQIFDFNKVVAGRLNEMDSLSKQMSR